MYQPICLLDPITNLTPTMHLTTHVKVIPVATFQIVVKIKWGNHNDSDDTKVVVLETRKEVKYLC